MDSLKHTQTLDQPSGLAGRDCNGYAVKQFAESARRLASAKHLYIVRFGLTAGVLCVLHRER